MQTLSINIGRNNDARRTYRLLTISPDNTYDASELLERGKSELPESAYSYRISVGIDSGVYAETVGDMRSNECRKVISALLHAGILDTRKDVFGHVTYTRGDNY